MLQYDSQSNTALNIQRLCTVNNEKNVQIEKCTKDTSGNWKTNIVMNRKKCSSSMAIRETQIKAIQYHFHQQTSLPKLWKYSQLMRAQKKNKHSHTQLMGVQVSVSIWQGYVSSAIKIHVHCPSYSIIGIYSKEVIRVHKDISIRLFIRASFTQ